MLVPISSFFTFAFFAFGTEATRDYRACGRWVDTTIFRRQTGSRSRSSSDKSSRLGSTKEGSLYGSKEECHPIHQPSLFERENSAGTTEILSRGARDIRLHVY
ncbi:hypothetical protein FB451DRAFT_1277896 [Mycena latifolia]|nr:hypothetical protein FB451DRAFT_1277896 [Mycena latifolia]